MIYVYIQYIYMDYHLVHLVVGVAGCPTDYGVLITMATHCTFARALVLSPPDMASPHVTTEPSSWEMVMCSYTGRE